LFIGPIILGVYPVKLIYLCCSINLKEKEENKYGSSLFPKDALFVGIRNSKERGILIQPILERFF
jgi:hypothetical protein